MAWPLQLDEETDSTEPVEDHVSSSTDNVDQPSNGLQNIYSQGAACLPLSNPHNLRVSNPYVNRIRHGRRYSSGDINQGNSQQVLGNNNMFFGRPLMRNGRRHSLSDNENAQRASETNQMNFRQRHSVPCCHINPSMLHCCCLHLKRHLSVESLNLGRKNSFPVDCPHGQVPETQTNGFAVHAEYERQRSFSISNSIMFRNENFQADSYMQQAIYALGHEFFMKFLADEMEQRGFQLPEDMGRLVDHSEEIPTSLVYLIDRFAASLEREMIFCLALRVQFPINLSCFIAIIDGMNNGSANPERIVTLFFFSADLAIRAFREGNVALFREIVSWTQWYLRRHHDTLVAVPSKRSSYKIAATACLVGIIAAIFVMKRNYHLQN